MSAKSWASPDVDALLNGFKASGKKLTLAARITGPAKTAFPDGLPKAAADTDKTADRQSGSEDRARRPRSRPR